MKEDRYLIFLANCKNDDLKTLVDILTHDKDGDVRYSEELTNIGEAIQLNYVPSLQSIC